VVLQPELDRALTAVAQVTTLLVACDYDGTLAPIVANPHDARPLPAAAGPLCALADLPATPTALISGRALADLARLSGAPKTVHLVGSHGSEFDSGFVHPIDDDAKARLSDIIATLRAIVAEFPGTAVEIKPASAALHVRNADPAAAAAALNRARAAAAGWDAQATAGKAVLEFAVIHTDKGDALDILRDRYHASAVVFIGDDVTDEKAFRRLRRGDVGIKVGPGDTMASYRVDAPANVAVVLERLLDLRRG